MIQNHHRIQLEQAGLRLFDYPDMLLLVKHTGAAGNKLPGWKSSPVVVMDEKLNVLETVHSDCPHLSIRLENNHFVVSVWDWVPGPGPGDFELTFAEASEAVKQALTYFLEPNPYFEARLKYELNK